MATQRKHRRGTTAQHAVFTGALGELTVDTDKKTVVVHDGTTAGGAPLLSSKANLSDLENVEEARENLGLGLDYGLVTEEVDPHQIRRGTTSENAAFTGAVAELTYDTDKKTIRVHDGATAGGIPLPRENADGGLTFSTTTTTVPWGGPYGGIHQVAHRFYSSTSEVADGNRNRATLAILRETVGGGANFLNGNDSAALFSVRKTDYLTSSVLGQVTTAHLTARQGTDGDASLIVGNIHKVGNTSGYGMTGLEIQMSNVNSAGTRLQTVKTVVARHNLVAGALGVGGVSFFTSVDTGTWHTAFMAAADNFGGNHLERLLSFHYQGNENSNSFALNVRPANKEDIDIQMGTPANHILIGWDRSTGLLSFKNSAGSDRLTLNGTTGVLTASGGLGIAGTTRIYADGGYVLPSYGQAAIASAVHAVNTTNKVAGKMVRDSTNNRIMVARGGAATDAWDSANSGTTVTPS